MPISPENRKRYPANWQAIRSAILQRANHCCEQCGVPNYAWIMRGVGPDAGTFMILNGGAVYDANTGEPCGYAEARTFNGRQRTRIILSIAHLDHTPEHNDPTNLKALCCRCHLLWDAQHHRQTAYRHQRQHRAIGDLFDEFSALNTESVALRI